MSWEAQAAVWKMDLKAGDKWVLMGLANYVNQDMECWPSLDLLSKKLGLKKAALIRHIQSLTRRGIITVFRKDHYGVNHYFLNLDQEKTGIKKKFDASEQIPKKEQKQVSKRDPNLLSETLLKEDNPKKLNGQNGHDDDPLTPEDIVISWNESFSHILPSVRQLTDARKLKLKARLREHPTLEFWTDVFTKINRSKFLTEQWRCSFDWVIANQVNCLKIVEGNYENRQGETYKARSSRA